MKKHIFFMAMLLLFGGSISAQTQPTHHLTPQNILEFNDRNGIKVFIFIESRPYILQKSGENYGQIRFQRSDVGTLEIKAPDGTSNTIDMTVDLFLWYGNDITKCMTIWYYKNGTIHAVRSQTPEQCKKSYDCKCVL